jgi:hypothetical protein
VCAGADDAADFFTQVCALAVKPLAIMNATRSNGGDLTDMANALTDAGYEVFATDTTNSQVEVTACAGPDRQWVLTPISNFTAACGGWAATDDSTPIGDDAAVDSCQPSTHGPPCTSDIDCVNVQNCLRCAGSGYCTDVPL